MSLTARLTAFFLAALAVVLAGFSGTLYALASRHLHAQADERVGAALAILAATAELEPGGLEWDRTQRTLSVGETTCWLVRDEHGQVVDHSPISAEGEPPWDATAGADGPATLTAPAGETWRA